MDTDDTTTPDLTDAIEDAAQSPAKASQDGTSGEAHPLDKVIESDQYLKANSALKKRKLGIRYVGLRAPSASDIYRHH